MLGICKRQCSHDRLTLSAVVILSLGFFSLHVPRLNAQGQAVFASLSGTVHDTSGAAVPEATVTISDPQRGFTRSFTTGPDGGYVLTSLPPSEYTLEVTKAGFSRYVQKGIVLTIEQTATLDVTLAVGQVKEQVTVIGAASVVNTRNANVGSNVSSTVVTELPLNVRNPFYLVSLNSSVNNSGQTQALSAGVPSIQSADAAFFNFGGSVFGTSAFLLDGHWNGSVDWTGIMYVPSPDATEEFSIQTNNFTAQYGLSMGNVVNAITKQGTRDIHASAYEFFRNSALDANNFFNNRFGLPKTLFHRNQFGGTIGGPLYIPKLYEQRDKTFFFFDFEALRQSTPATFTTTIPTAVMRTGDFSALLGPQMGSDALGRPVLQGQIYNPFTTRTITAGSVDPVTGLMATQSGFIRDPFSGNIIPTGMISNAAGLLQKFYPDPTNSQLINNFVGSAGIPSAATKRGIRIDHNISEKSRFFARWSHDPEYRTEGIAIFGASNPAGPGDVTLDPRWDIGLGYSRTLSPTFILSLTGGWNWWNETRQPQGVPFSLSTVGLPSALDEFRNEFPVMNIENFQGLGSSGVTYSQLYDKTFAADFTKIHGSHMIQFGYQHITFQNNSGFTPPVTFNFATNVTQGPDPTTANPDTGSAYAAFLLGTGSNGGLDINAAAAFTKNYDAWYVQDEWKVTPKLTTTVGLRYDIQFPPTERFNRLPYFDFNSPNPLQAMLAAANGGTSPLPVPGQLVYTSASNRHMFDTDFKNFAPRISLAYRIKENLVARAGFGIFYQPDILVGDYQGMTLTGFSQSTPYVGTVDGITPVNLLDNPFPNGILLPPGRSQGGLTDVGLTPDATNRNRPSPYTEQWTFSLQYALGSRDSLEATYVGNHGVKMLFPAGFQLDQLPPQDLSLGNSLLNPVANPFFGFITSSACGLDQPTVPQGQLLRPYPEFCGVGGVQPPGGFSSYNGVTFTFKREWSQGLHFLASYTISKFLDNTEGNGNWASSTFGATPVRNYYNTAAEKSLDLNDIPESLVLSYIYQLPVGKGKRFGANMGRVADGLVGGWQVSGITTFKKGFPLSISAATNNTNSFGGGQRPNLVGNPNFTSSNPRPSGVDRVDEWFNTAAFAQPAPFTFGNVGQTLPNTRAPGINNFDLSLEKWFQVTERFRIEFRGEFYNAFNHTNLLAPDQTFGDPSFGQIFLAAPPRDIQLGLKLSF